MTIQDTSRTPPAAAIGARRIDKLLVANRGEIARRIIRSCRELGIATVAVVSDPDRHAPFAAEATEIVVLGGSTSAESYLRIGAIIEAAERTGADAIHPGYGFLAENAELARRCVAAGIVFVGPSAEVIDAMGSKIEAKKLMAAAGVPVLGGFTVTDEVTPAELAAEADALGWPLLAKASAGGGGKGMRVVSEPAGLVDAVSAARREARSAFGDDTLFLERYVERSRHVEIQIFGDHDGNVVALFERECSIQRRHQKIIEESPSPALDDALRARMCDAATAAGRTLGYVGAGTVEFLLTPDGEFFFLEVNTRLQVEHPVTELVTGLDLVRLQIQVAEGAPLPPQALNPTLVGHAIEVRLYAEDPEHDFLPQTGRLERFEIPAADGIRVDAGVVSGSEIGVHYDPMIAKVIAHGSTRDDAARRLARALRDSELHGMVTNRDFLVRLLEHPEFLAGEIDTHFLQRHPASVLGAPLLIGLEAQLCAVAAALAGQAERRVDARVLRRIPSGFRNNPSQLQPTTLQGPSGPLLVEHRLERSGWQIRIDGVGLEGLEVHGCRPDAVELGLDGVIRCYRAHHVGEHWWINSSFGQCHFRELPRFPEVADDAAAGSLTSPMPGLVLRVTAEVGARVERGTPLLVIEAMKMEHEIVAPSAGTVTEIAVAAGQQVEAGMVLAIIDGEAGC